MSKRLRFYAKGLAIWHLGVAACLWIANDNMRRNPSFRFLFAVMPWWLWMCFFALIGVSSGTTLLQRSDGKVRGLGVVSAAVASAWAVNFALSFIFDHDQASPLGAFIFGFL